MGKKKNVNLSEIKKIYENLWYLLATEAPLFLNVDMVDALQVKPPC